MSILPIRRHPYDAELFDFPDDAFGERSVGLALDELLGSLRHRQDAGLVDLLAHADAEAAVSAVELLLPRPVRVKVTDTTGYERQGAVTKLIVNWHASGRFTAFLFCGLDLVATFRDGDQLDLLDGAP